MRKIFRNVMICLLAASFFFLGGILANPDLLSLEQERQQIWNTPAESMKTAMKDVLDLQSARIYLRENLDGICRAVDQTMEELGWTDRAAVARSWKAFCSQKAEELSSSAVIKQVLAGNGEIGVFLRDKLGQLADFMAEE